MSKVLRPPKGHLEAGERQWFRVQAKNNSAAKVFIYDEIGRGFFGGGVAPEDFIKEVNDLKLGAEGELKVHINSPGGNYFDGNAIYNYLRTIKAKVVTIVDGVAASAASLVAMAGDRIEMPENAMMFIHNPWLLVVGDANTMRKASQDLDHMRDGAVATYLSHAGDKLTRDKLVEMLDAETWLSAEDSVKHGLADAVISPLRAAALAQFDFSKYGFPVPKAITSAKDALAEEMRRRRQQLKLLSS